MTERIQRSATINIAAPIEEAFALFGPIREKDWAHGWNPEVLYPKETLVAKHMIFRTQGGLHGSQEPYTWVIVNYEPEDHMIEYIVSASERLWFITVTCVNGGSGTAVTVVYSYTGFTPETIKRNKVSIQEMFASELKDWEKAINHYLKTGTQLVN